MKKITQPNQPIPEVYLNDKKENVLQQQEEKTKKVDLPIQILSLKEGWFKRNLTKSTSSCCAARFKANVRYSSTFTLPSSIKNLTISG